MARPTPNFTILPAVLPNGKTIQIQTFTDVGAAKLAAVKATAAEDAQYIVYAAVSYTEKVKDWPQEAVDQLVLPF